jgi:hypothetical protein
MWRESASYVDHIHRGEKAAKSAGAAADKLELIINLRTATQIDMTMPETLLLLADGLIE